MDEQGWPEAPGQPGRQWTPDRSGPGRTVRLVGALVAGLLGMILIAGVTAYLAWPDRQSAGSPAPSPAPRVGAVTYEITGRGTARIVYLDPAQRESVVLPDQQLPWRIELPRQPLRFVQVTASRDETDSGPRTGRILLDGVEVCQQSDQAAYTNVGCSALVPPV
jgi:hypothetical protein